MSAEYTGLIGSTGTLYLAVGAIGLAIGVSMYTQRKKNDADYAKGTVRHNEANGIYQDVQIEKYLASDIAQIYVPDDYEGAGYEPGELVNCKIWGIIGSNHRDFSLAMHNHHAKQKGGTKNAYGKVSVQFLPSRSMGMPDVIIAYPDGGYAAVVAASNGLAVPDYSETHSEIAVIHEAAQQAEAAKRGAWGMSKSQRTKLFGGQGGKKK